MRGYRIVLLPRSDQGVARGLDSLNLRNEKFEPVEFAADLCLEVIWQRAAVTSTKSIGAPDDLSVSALNRKYLAKTAGPRRD